MLAYALVIYLLSFTTIFATEPYSPQAELEERANMQEKVQTFIQSLQLVPSQHVSLISQLEKAQIDNGSTASSNTNLACQVARACLGPGSVATKPVNETEADANWLVIPYYFQVPNGNLCDKGLKHAGQRRHAYYFHNRV